jgi:hypothetical protein
LGAATPSEASSHQPGLSQKAHGLHRIVPSQKPIFKVAFPTKLALTINLKTAKTLGLKLPPTLLTRADEVIGETSICCGA